MKQAKGHHYAVKDNGQLTMSVKDVSTSSRVVCAVLNTYNYLDSDNDVLMPGCCAKSIKERGVDSKAPNKILHALFHDTTRLPGKIQVLDERTIDGKEVLYMESKLSDTTEGNDTLKNYLAGIYNQHSIGFQYTKGQWVQRDAHGNSKQWDKLMESLINPEDAKDLDGIFRVEEIKLFEGSTVAFGANAATPTLGIKSHNKDAVMLDYMSRIDLLEKTLRDGTQSDEMMYRIELQVRQLKQAMVELFDQFQIKSIKTGAVMVCQTSTCSAYNEEPDDEEPDNDPDDMKCSKCGGPMGPRKSAPVSFFSKLAKELTK